MRPILKNTQHNPEIIITAGQLSQKFCMIINKKTTNIRIELRASSVFHIRLFQMLMDHLCIYKIQKGIMYVYFSFRAMGVCLSMMIGRSGSMVGSNLIGWLLEVNCGAGFYLFGGFLIGKYFLLNKLTLYYV